MPPIERIHHYNWSPAGGLPDIEYHAFATLNSRGVYTDVCKAEQLTANILQQRRLVALVSDDIVLDYTIIEPDPNSPHRSR